MSRKYYLFAMILLVTTATTLCCLTLIQYDLDILSEEKEWLVNFSYVPFAIAVCAPAFSIYKLLHILNRE